MQYLFGNKYLETNFLLMDDIKLLGLQRAEFQRAKSMSSHSNKAQVAIVLLSIVAIFVKTPLITYIFAVTNFVIALAWLYLSFQTKDSHATAERARRAVVFSNGLGIKLGRKSYTDLKMSFKVSDTDGEKYEDSSYFKTPEEYGNKKLAKIVEESSFWSKHLFKISATHYWIYFSVALTVSIVGLLLVPLLNIGNFNILVSQMFCLVLTWLITGNLFSMAIAFTNAASVADDLESRLANMAMNEKTNQDVLIVVSDYDALVENSPIIPTKIYEKNRKRLDRLWTERNT